MRGLRRGIEARLRPRGLRRARFAIGHHVAAPRVAEGEAWWSQAGSNRRPRHCERRALPAELWPRRDRLSLNKGGRQSGPFTVRAKAKSRTAKSTFPGLFCRAVPLFAPAGTDI